MNAISELHTLQIEQQRHDDVAHRDILNLAVQDRVKHMVLHFAKYCGHLADLHETRNEERFVNTLVDTFIISLACANALHLKLSEVVTSASVSEIDLGQSSEPSEISSKMFPKLAKATGTLAKACESLDHFERLNYHAILESGVAQIASQCIAAANKGRIDLFALSRARWARIERKIGQTQAAVKPENLRLAAKG